MKNFKFIAKCFAWIITCVTIGDLLNRKTNKFIVDWLIS